MDSMDDSDFALSQFSSNSSDFFLSNMTSTFGSGNMSNSNDNISVPYNYSEYIVPPEKEGSPYAACASIVLKSDLKVTNDPRVKSKSKLLSFCSS